MSTRPRAGRRGPAQTTLIVALVGLLLALFGTLAGLAPTLSAWIHKSVPVELTLSRSGGEVAAPGAGATETGGALTESEGSTTTVIYLPLANRGGRAVSPPRQKPVAPPSRPQDPKQNVPILPALAVPLPVTPAQPPSVREVANAQIARRIAADVDRPPATIPLPALYRSAVPPTGAGSAGHPVDPAAPIRAGPLGVFL